MHLPSLPVVRHYASVTCFAVRQAWVASLETVSSICVPDTATAAALTGLPAGVAVIVWDGRLPAPDGIDDVEFFVPGYGGAEQARSVLDLMPKLRVIQLLTAGVENWLDQAPAGVTLCGGRGVHGGSTAELAVAAILSHLRQLPRFAAQQRRRHWDKTFTDGLRDRRVLVLGAGDIGRRVAAAVRVFDGEPTLVARHAREGVHTLEELPDLLPDQQVVVIALPDTPETTGLVDAKFLAALPDGALVVNVARGPLVQTDALLAELNSGRLFAFLDVFDVEPLPADHPLWTAPNVVLTPHVGGGTTGWEQAAFRLVRDQVQRFLTGEPLVNVVEEGY
jgi:phosphoglycerate dehydrogenase-like enzyme